MSLVIQSFCILLLLIGSGPLFAELPVARLFTVFPPGGKIGSQFEVTLTGADLDDANQLHFSHTGITAKQKVGETNDVPEANKFLITIATNVPPGVYEARVVGRFGISNPRAFVVGDLPETIAPTTNRSPANATAIALGTIINGHSESNTVDFYKFTARKGQRILIGCNTIRYIPTTTRITDESWKTFLLRGESVPGINTYYPFPAYQPGEHFAGELVRA